MENKESNFTFYPEIGKVYSHYKGGDYEVLTLAKHSETQEDLVIYKSIPFGSIYARPLTMWFEEIPNEKVENLSSVADKRVVKTRFTLKSQ